MEIIDSGKLNGQSFFNMAGMGFDAHISEVFSHGKKRGFFTYIKNIPAGSCKIPVAGLSPRN